MPKFLSALTCLMLAASFSASGRASESAVSILKAHEQNPDFPSFEAPIGLGVAAGVEDGKALYGAVLEGQNHFSQRRGEFGIRRYGEGEARAEAGNNLGVSLSAVSGITLYGLDERRTRFSPQLGFEPFSGRITWDSSDTHNNYYEWLPMLSAGPQFAAGSCRILPIVRGGCAVGTIAKPGLLPGAGLSYGAGAFVNCFRFDLGAAVNRIEMQGQTVSLATADLSYSFSPNGLKIGLRGESEPARVSSPNAPNSNEERVLVIMRTRMGY